MEFLWIGKTKDKRIADLEQDYLDRIRRFAPVSAASIAEEPRRDDRQLTRADRRETQQIRARLPKKAFVIVLDEKGGRFSSRELSKFLRDLMNRGTRRVCFIVGGHAGVPEEVKAGADKLLSLSRMTLPHELTRVFLLEQVYRAQTLIKGLPYHK